MKKMNVLSLFDGLSGAHVALNSLGIDCTYYSSEIDPAANAVSNNNYPDIIRLGDVKQIKGKNLPQIHLLIGGSPCQSLSGLHAFRSDDLGAGLNGKSGLFFEYVRLLREVKPKYFLLENVASMSIKDRDYISSILGVQPIRINSKLLTAQLRDRLYWTNIPNVQQPANAGILFSDILKDGYTERKKALCMTQSYFKASIQDYVISSLRQMVFTSPVIKSGNTYTVGGKTATIEKGPKYLPNTEAVEILRPHMRKLYPVEAEALQGLPEVEKTVYLHIWKENYQEYLKNHVNAEDLKHTGEIHVGNAEKKECRKSAVYAEQNSHQYPQKSKRHAVKNVLINCGEKTVEILSQGKLILSVDFAETQNMSPLQKCAQDFVHMIVFINTVAERIILHGEAESHLKDKFFINQMNRNIVLNLFGKEIKQLVKNAEINSTTHKKLLKSITSYPSKSLSSELTWKILSFFVTHAINGFIPKKIQKENLSVRINIRTGYTFGQSDKERFRMIGNGFTVPVIAHILSHMEPFEQTNV